MFTIREEAFADIPALHIFKEEHEQKPLPTFLFWHGFSSGKEHNLHVAYRLAKKGIRVILPEAVHHGERDQGLTEKQRMLEFWSIVLQSLKETGSIKKDLDEKKLIKDNRLFMGGTSMGGILTCGALTVYPWIKGAVVLMGNPSWEVFARKQMTMLEQQGSLPLSEEDAEKQVQKLIDYDLSQKEQALGERPLFFWHGRDDEVVPYHESYSFYEKMKEKRKEDSSLVYHLDPSAGHKVSRNGMIAMADWVEDYI
ncbi:prolyl oligopeptidase family serine peptidase [Alteribacillus sp. JSM 102045]|uniref:prolyl oligopeptidase family serine peptidase n=1 Tax=Alteribacillus sp. JSM 102045 TaxID=1562101 RepID=UPI0035C07CCB